jgi:hypothetical protein
VAIEDFAASTNELTRIFVRQELGPQDFRDATGIACKALNNLYNDREFATAFTSLSALADQQAEQVSKVIDDIDHFTRHFLRREFKLLEENFQIEPLLLAAVRTAAQDLQLLVRSERPSWLQVRRRVASLRDDACAISHGLKQVLELPIRKKRLLRYAIGALGGVVMIGNHTPIGLAQFSPAGAASSGKLGFALITLSATPIYSKVLDKIGAALG